MKDIEKVLENFRSIEKLIHDGHLVVDDTEATVTMDATLFSQMASYADGRPNRWGFAHFVENLRAYINFRRGYHIGAEGQLVHKGDDNGLLKKHETLNGHVVALRPDGRYTEILAFSHANGVLEGPEAI